MCVTETDVNLTVFSSVFPLVIQPVPVPPGSFPQETLDRPLLNIHLGLKFYNGTFIKSWNSLNLHSNFFNYPNKPEAETSSVFIHSRGL